MPPGAPSGTAPQVPTARKPEAVKPAVVKPRPVPAQRPPEREIRPGDLICSHCKGGNDPGRRFCRSCGNSLVEAQEAVVPPPLPWWKRPFVRQSKVLAAGERPMRRGGVRGNRRQPLRRLWQARRAFALLAVVGLGIGLLGPWRSTVKAKATEIRKKVTPHYDEVFAKNIEASSALKGHDARLAVDTVKNNYWAEDAEGNGEGQWLQVTFSRPVNLGKIGFRVGAADNVEDFATQPRPAVVLVESLAPPPSPAGQRRSVDATPNSATIELKDTRDFQAHSVKMPGTTALKILIVDVATSVATGSACSIAEIEFFEKS